jgi:retron-type reverse transcriptase
LHGGATGVIISKSSSELSGIDACPQHRALALRLDRRLAGLARSFGFAYTRYADDLTFSGDDPTLVAALHATASRVIAGEGFRVNTAKTHVARRGARQEVTGVVVNDVLGLSRRERRRLRAMIHQTRRALDEGTADPARLAELRGQLADLAMLNPAQANVLRRGFARGSGGAPP